MFQVCETGGKMKICGLDEDTLLDEAEGSTAHSENMESVQNLFTVFKIASQFN